MLDQLKPGDTLLIQFGHNDGARIGDPAGKNRGSVPGIGPETVEDTRPDGTKEMVQSFGWYIARYINDAKAKGASVVVLSPIPHKDRWKPEQPRDFENYAAWGEQVRAGQWRPIHRPDHARDRRPTAQSAPTRSTPSSPTPARTRTTPARCSTPPSSSRA